jgi:Secretion system C-terminal sorting domain
MKKTILAYFLYLVTGQAVQSQSFGVSSAYSNQQGTAQQDISAPVTIKNNTGRTLDLRWEIDRSNLPTGWSALVCDRFCKEIENKPMQFFLNPNESLPNFRVLFSPNGLEGMANIELVIYEAGNRSQTETSVLFNASAVTKGGGQKIYPNPASEHISLQDDDASIKVLEIYNMVGRKVLEFSVNASNERYDVSALPRGIYMVRLLDTSRNIVRTQRISKYNP